MESHLSTVILLLVLCATDVKPDDVPKDVETPYDKFLRQHVYEDMNVQKCDNVITKERKIKSYDSKTKKNKCKEVNSFIKADKHLITTVCNRAGTYDPIKKLYVSNQPFPVVTCKEKKGSKYPKCQYRGNKSTRYIVLGCDNGQPTHYDEGIIVTSSE